MCVHCRNLLDLLDSTACHRDTFTVTFLYVNDVETSQKKHLWALGPVARISLHLILYRFLIAKTRLVSDVSCDNNL
jgi:hypothetical protein